MSENERARRDRVERSNLKGGCQICAQIARPEAMMEFELWRVA